MKVKLNREEILELYRAGLRDFRWIDMRNLDLREINLMDSDLRGVNFKGSMLKDTVLAFTNMKNAIIEGAIGFKLADIEGAKV